jgi:deoxyribodipyrimidine photo-lyase
MQTAIVWFTNDLRTDDQVALFQALQLKIPVVGAYFFDERHFRLTPLGFRKTGAFRTQFLLETVQDLRQQLKNLGIPLLVRQGKPEQELPKLAETLNAKYVLGSQEATSEELNTQKAVAQRLLTIHCELKLYWQATLIHIDDLPFKLQLLPDIFTEFRKSVERNSKTRNTVRPKAQQVVPFELPEGVELGNLPTLKDLGFEAVQYDSRSVLAFRGGETAAKSRLEEYFWEKDLLKVYKETRNGLVGADYSCKFSAWLAVGAISPRRIYEEILRYEAQRTKNESTYWLFFELLWRDYFRFIAKKYQNRLFYADGLKGNYDLLGVKDDKNHFQKWVNGKTGQPFVDANMIELLRTGFMSNRGRQNVASYLVKDLKVNWRWGAAYFESQLLDYDVCSNWGNWNYVAGVGNDPRENRYFNVAKQAQQYDPQGEYVKLWLNQV